MESEKVKEIKKGLEFMMRLDLSNKLPYIDGNTPKQIAYEEIFNYINELESENKRLSDTEIGELIKENEELAKQCEDWCEIILKKRNQIVELKDQIAELENEIRENAFYSKGYAQGIKNTYEVVIPDKLKQFAEKIKDLFVEDDQTREEIDETLKEFIDE